MHAGSRPFVATAGHLRLLWQRRLERLPCERIDELKCHRQVALEGVTAGNKTKRQRSASCTLAAEKEDLQDVAPAIGGAMLERAPVNVVRESFCRRDRLSLTPRGAPRAAFRSRPVRLGADKLQEGRTASLDEVADVEAGWDLAIREGRFTSKVGRIGRVRLVEQEREGGGEVGGPEERRARCERVGFGTSRAGTRTRSDRRSSRTCRAL